MLSFGNRYKADADMNAPRFDGKTVLMLAAKPSSLHTRCDAYTNVSICHVTSRRTPSIKSQELKPKLFLEHYLGQFF